VRSGWRSELTMLSSSKYHTPVFVLVWGASWYYVWIGFVFRSFRLSNWPPCPGSAPSTLRKFECFEGRGGLLEYLCQATSAEAAEQCELSPKFPHKLRSLRFTTVVHLRLSFCALAFFHRLCRRLWDERSRSSPEPWVMVSRTCHVLALCRFLALFKRQSCLSAPAVRLIVFDALSIARVFVQVLNAVGAFHGDRELTQIFANYVRTSGVCVTTNLYKTDKFLDATTLRFVWYWIFGWVFATGATSDFQDLLLPK